MRRAAVPIGGARCAVVVAVAVLSLAAPGAALAEAPVQPYGTNDAGGFRNVLPPGENGLDNAAQLAEFQLNGTYPPHFKDQLPLYAGLIYASPDADARTDPAATSRTPPSASRKATSNRPKARART